MSLQIELPIDILNILQLYIGGFVCGNMEELTYIQCVTKNIDIIFSKEKTRNTVHKHLIRVCMDDLPDKYLQCLSKSISLYPLYVRTVRLPPLMRFKNISSIKIPDMTPYTLANVSKFINLEHLELPQSSGFGLTKDITNLTKLTDFKSSSDLTDTDIGLLSTLPKLRKLDIQIERYTNRFNSFKNLANLKNLTPFGNLKNLSISFATCSTDMLKDISNIKTLEIVSFRYCKIDFKDLLILNNLKKLYSLTITGITITYEDLEYVSELHRISKLCAYDCNIPVAALLQLCALEKLDYLKINKIDNFNQFKKQFIKKIGHHVNICT